MHILYGHFLGWQEVFLKRFPNVLHFLVLKGCCYKPCAMLGFVACREEEFDPGPEMRLDHLKLLCNKVLLKYKRDSESF